MRRAICGMQPNGLALRRAAVFAPRLSPSDTWRVTDWRTVFSTHYLTNAHTTASDALWAGLPILTCLGSTFPGRVAASLLQAAGLPELIMHSLDAYEEYAVRLARDPRQSRRSRQNWRSAAEHVRCSTASASPATLKRRTSQCINESERRITVRLFDCLACAENHFAGHQDGRSEPFSAITDANIVAGQKGRNSSSQTAIGKLVNNPGTLSPHHPEKVRATGPKSH